jgi:peroxiredoxin family protein
VPPEPAAVALPLIVHAGDYERVHYALVLASGGAAIDRKPILFFTGPAVVALIDWTRLDGSERDAQFRANGVAGYEELLAACAALGVRIIACEMALKARGHAAGALRRDITIEIAGVVTLLQAAGSAGVTFI